MSSLNFLLELKPYKSGFLLTMQHKKRPEIKIKTEVPRVMGALSLPAFITGLMSAWAKKNQDHTRRALPPQQADFYKKLVMFHVKHNRAPTQEEMTSFGDFKSKATSNYYCRNLVDAGWAWKDGTKIIPVDVMPVPEAT